MAPKTRTATVTLTGETTAETPQQSAQAALEDADDLEGGALIAITDEILATSGVVVQLVRQEPREFRGHVADMTPGEFSAERVGVLYGPGVYRVRFVGPGNRYLPGGGQLRIAPKRTGGAAEPAAAATEPGGVLEFITRREAERDARRERDEEKARARRMELITLALGAAPAIAAIIGALKGGSGNSELITALVQGMKPAPAAPPPTMAEIVTTLEGLKKLSGTERAAPDPLEQLGRLMEIAKGMAPGGDSEGGGASGSNWMDMVRDALKMAPEALKALQGSGPQSVPVIVQPQPNPQLQQQPTQPPAEGADMFILIQPVLRDAAAKIETWAKEGKNPELRAEVLLEDLPAWLADRLEPKKALEFLNHPQWWEHLTAFHPPLAAHRAWIDKLRAALIEIVTEQIKPEAAPGAAPADNAGEADE